ncbi:MAG: S-layer homology domain-containing protein [Candidatus Peribacteraceae bacterium]|nr:S-layer homology domain-containing protein [Candidatus Peribacteraceae bacterium]
MRTKNTLNLLITFLGIVIPISTWAASASVLDVVDGDTLRVEVDGVTEKVRIIGIDTAETVDPRKPVQCFGKEASDHMKELLSGKTIELETNPAEDRDVYDRLLRYVRLDGEDVGAAMVRDGYAHSYKKYPHPRLEDYNELEREAHEANRGLWSSCNEGEQQSLFSDITSNHPYISAIEWGKNSNVLSGYPDGTFQPDKTVNRAELLKIMLAAKGIDVANFSVPSSFSDVDESAWYAPYIRFAKHEGVVQGYEDGTFRPNQAVNFVEALKMAYLIYGIDTQDTGGEWYSRFLNHARSNSILFNGNADIASGMARQDVVWIAYKLKNWKPATTSSKPVSKSSSSQSSVQNQTTECLIKGNISTKTDERIYHVQGCGSYNQTVIDTSKGERWFCTEEEAVASGWRKALNCP